jgi:hypothetical protein
MKTSSCKAKMRKLQYYFCSLISEATGLPWGKDCPIESRPSGQNGTDVRLDDKALKLFPFSVECKNQETWSLPAYIKQSQTNQVEGTDWLLVLSKNEAGMKAMGLEDPKDPIVVLPAKTFFKVIGPFIERNRNGR